MYEMLLEAKETGRQSIIMNKPSTKMCGQDEENLITAPGMEQDNNKKKTL